MTDIYCDTTHVKGSKYEDYYDLLGAGCYCGSEIGFEMFGEEKCCFYGNNCNDETVNCYKEPKVDSLVAGLGDALESSGGKKHWWQGKK